MQSAHLVDDLVIQILKTQEVFCYLIIPIFDLVVLVTNDIVSRHPQRSGHSSWHNCLRLLHPTIFCKTSRIIVNDDRHWSPRIAKSRDSLLYLDIDKSIDFLHHFLWSSPFINWHLRVRSTEIQLALNFKVWDLWWARVVLNSVVMSCTRMERSSVTDRWRPFFFLSTVYVRMQLTSSTDTKHNWHAIYCPSCSTSSSSSSTVAEYLPLRTHSRYWKKKRFVSHEALTHRRSRGDSLHVSWTLRSKVFFHSLLLFE